MLKNTRPHINRHEQVFILLTVLFMFMFSSGCISRLRQDLYLSHGETTRRITVQGTQLFRKAEVNLQPVNETDIIVGGDGNVLVVTSEHRGEGGAESRDSRELFTFDAVVRLQLYVSLPLNIRPDSILVTSSMFAQRIGEYSLPIEDLRYVGQGGNLIIDSVAREFLYARIDARFQSRTGDSVRYHGNFKARVER